MQIRGRDIALADRERKPENHAESLLRLAALVDVATFVSVRPVLPRKRAESLITAACCDDSHAIGAGNSRDRWGRTRSSDKRLPTKEVDNAGLFIHAGHRSQKAGLLGEASRKPRYLVSVRVHRALWSDRPIYAWRSWLDSAHSREYQCAVGTFRVRERFCSYVPHNITPRYTVVIAARGALCTYRYRRKRAKCFA